MKSLFSGRYIHLFHDARLEDQKAKKTIQWPKWLELTKVQINFQFQRWKVSSFIISPLLPRDQYRFPKKQNCFHFSKIVYRYTEHAFQDSAKIDLVDHRFTKRQTRFD